jgi:glucose-1-phosphate adenylyltransferase
VTILAAEQTATSEAGTRAPPTPCASRCRTSAAIRTTGHHPLRRPALPMDYRRDAGAPRAAPAEITVAVTPVVARGRARLRHPEDHRAEPDHRVLREAAAAELDGKESPVSAKWRAGRVYLASMGIYIFNADVLREVLDEPPGPERLRQGDHPRRHPRAAGRDRLSVHRLLERHRHRAVVLRDQHHAGQPKPDFNLYDRQWPLYTNARMLPPAKITRSTVEHAIIGEGSVIVDSEITDSVIGIRSFIDGGRGSTAPC